MACSELHGPSRRPSCLLSARSSRRNIDRQRRHPAAAATPTESLTADKCRFKWNRYLFHLGRFIVSPTAMYM
uniref:Uncharacterized protein n=1 Tax=Oryza sativa subsp. japonica TaxID=39947 RepID=Q6YSJ1_ORYSJ|nr:hypothetical protein [Oryza sativa Japonica Group]BAD32050.1 hypothetical protein [Oryza sativa Japonica Group]